MADFGAVALGTPSAPTTFTVTAGPGATGYPSLDGPIINEPATSPFRLANNQCSGGYLSPGQQCTFDVLFSPTAEGSNSSGVSVQSSDGSAASADLVGVAN